MNVQLCFLNAKGEPGTGGPVYDIQLDVLPRKDEHLMLEIEDEKFFALVEHMDRTSMFQVVYVLHAYESYNDTINVSHTLFIKPIYAVF